MMDVLTQPAARLDRSRAVTTIEPTVERRHRRWQSQPVGAEIGETAEMALAERLSGESQGLPLRETAGSRLGDNDSPQPQSHPPGISAQNAAALAVEAPRAAAGLNIADGPGGGEVTDSESGGTKPGNTLRPGRLPSLPDPRPRGQRSGGGPEPPLGTSSVPEPGPPSDSGQRRSALRLAGFPEACVERSVAPEIPPGRAAEAGFRKAAVGSDPGGNPNLATEGAGAEAGRKALPDAAGALTTPVRILFKPTPRYPEEALGRCLQGDVLLDVEFRYSGTLDVLGVRRGLGHGCNESAIEAARRLRFTAARRDGRSVDTQATLRVRFQLLR